MPYIDRIQPINSFFCSNTVQLVQKAFHTLFFKLQPAFTLKDIMQVMGIRASDKIVARKISPSLLETVNPAVPGAFQILESVFFRNGAEGIEHAEGFPVYMGWHYGTSHVSYHGDRIGCGKSAGTHQKSVFGSNFLIQAIHVDLLSENILAVPEGKEILKNFSLKSISRSGIGKITQEMNFFSRAQFHTRDHQQFTVTGHFKNSCTVPCGVMIGYGDYIKPFNPGHIDNVVGRHVIIGAG
jgi:hypothetical protein